MPHACLGLVGKVIIGCFRLIGSGGLGQEGLPQLTEKRCRSGSDGYRGNGGDFDFSSSHRRIKMADQDAD